jgi:hypothetical protein
MHHGQRGPVATRYYVRLGDRMTAGGFVVKNTKGRPTTHCPTVVCAKGTRATQRVRLRKLVIDCGLGQSLEIESGIDRTDQVIVNPSDSVAGGDHVSGASEQRPARREVGVTRLSGRFGLKATPAEGDRRVLGEFDLSLQHLQNRGVAWEDHEVGRQNKRGGH